MAKLLSGEIRSLSQLSTTPPGPHGKLNPEQDPTPSSRRGPPSTARKGKTLARRKQAPSRRYNSDDDYDDSDAPNARNASVRTKPTQAALETQRMLEESGSGRYWGAVYSLDGERIGMSYVGNNLQNVTLQTVGFSSASVTDYSPSPSRQPRKRVYVGRWQDAWDSRPENLDEEDETPSNKRSRDSKKLGHARRFYYVGNQNIVRAWRKAQSKAVQRHLVDHLPPSDDVDIRTPPPRLRALDKPSASDQHEVTDAPPTDGNPIDGEEEDEGDVRNFWIMEDRSSPKKQSPHLRVAADPSPSGSGDVSNVTDLCSTSTLESCGQPVTQEDLVSAVASSLQAVGTTVLLPEPPLLGS